MITITDTLQAAAEADSRSPIFDVNIIQKRMDLKTTAYTPSVAVHRLVDSGSGFWVASGFEKIGSPTTIYAKKITDLLSTDWESGWTTVATNVENVHVHDLYADGNDCRIHFFDRDSVNDYPEIWESTSSDGGTTWSAAAALIDDTDWPTGIDDTCYVLAISFIDIDNWYYAVGWSTDGEGVYIARSQWTGSAWAGRYINYRIKGMHDLMINPTYAVQQQAFARPLIGDDYTEFFVFNSRSGIETNDTWQGVFVLESIQKEYCGYISPSLGCLETQLDYTFELRGMSREAIGGHYIGGMLETYNEYADVNGTSIARNFYISTTKDGHSFNLIPIDSSIMIAQLLYYHVAGVVEDTDGTIVFVLTRDRGDESSLSTIVYTEPTWITGYETGTSVADDVIDQISIDRAVRETAKTGIVLTNAADEYTGSELVTEGNIVRIETGYKTTAGDELQNRFTGEIVSVNRTFEPNTTTELAAYDCLYPATLKAGRPHVLMGQNLFRADFSVTDDDKKMVPQSGVWGLSSNRYSQTEKSVNAFALCGYDPDSMYSVTVKLRADASITDVKMGIVVGYNSEELYDRKYTVVCYNETTGAIEFGYVDSTGTYHLIETIASSISWSADTDYWMRIFRGHNETYIISWKTAATSVWPTNSASEPIETGPKEYPGVFCYVPGSGTSVSFDHVEVVGLNPPLTGSTLMKYIAGTCGMETDEQYRVFDDFDGSSFSSDWTEGPNGTWTISGSLAQGSGTITAPAEACVNTFVAKDVCAMAYLVPFVNTNNKSGISLRSDCYDNRYEFIVSNNYATIAKVVDGSRTVLDYVYDSGHIFYVSSALAQIVFCAIGPWLLGFGNGALLVYAYDSSLESGHVGILSSRDSGYESEIEEFTVEGFYVPIPGVVTINAKDSFMEVMNQAADTIPGSQFFCNEDGALKWGVFPEDEDADLDIESVVLDRSETRGLDKITTAMSLVGDLVYSNARFETWATRLSRHIADNAENKLIQFGEEAYRVALDLVLQSYRIKETAVNIRANPALELCDIVTVENGTTYLYDTFTDTPTDLKNHTPDIDLVGGGWQHATATGFYISSNEARGQDYSDLTWLDVGVTDFVAEIDFLIPDDMILPTFRFCFRGISGSVGSFLKVSYNPESDKVTVSDSHRTYDSIGSAGFALDTWIHLKVTCTGNSAVFEVTSAGKEYIISCSYLPYGSTRTCVGLDVDVETTGYYCAADNLIVYSPDCKGQLLSLGETIGAAYEMSLPGMVGEREYR